MHDLPNLAILAIGVLATSFLSGIFGMAGGMVLMGLLLAIMPLTAAMALHGITQMASNGWRAWVWRVHVGWRVVLHYAIGSAISVALFTLLAVRPTKGQSLLILGLTPFIGLLLPARARLTVVRPTHAGIAGLVCMALQLLAGVSGPLLDVFFVHSGLGRRGIVATKAAVQTLSHALKIAYFGTLLAVEGGDLPAWVAVTAVALAFTGTHASRGILQLMSDAQFITWSRRIIVAVSTVYLLQGTLMVVREARASLPDCAGRACAQHGG